MPPAATDGDGRQFLLRGLGDRTESLTAERRRELLDAATARARLSSESSFARLRAHGWPLVQTAVAATVAWTIGSKVFGHPSPFFAPVAAVMALGATRGQRGRRAIELMLGVALGVGLGDLLVRAIGIGIAQLALVIVLAMAA